VLPKQKSRNSFVNALSQWQRERQAQYISSRLQIKKLERGCNFCEKGYNRGDILNILEIMISKIREMPTVILRKIRVAKNFE
jgi:hypothetical protein